MRFHKVLLQYTTITTHIFAVSLSLSGKSIHFVRQVDKADFMVRAEADGRGMHTSNRKFEEGAFELHLAEMETRLRAAVTELVEPTVQKITVLNSEVEHLTTSVARHMKELDSIHLGQLRFQEQVGAVATMKDEMAKWDSQRKIYEAAVDESLEAMRHKLDSQRFALEQKESTLHHLNRNLDRVASEVNRLLEDQDAVREVCESRVDEQSKRLTLFKAESEVRFARMERQHNALSDELWGDELGLAKVAGELKKTNATFGKLEDAVAALQEEKAEAVQLEKLRADVAKMVHEANTATSQMRQTVGEVVNDVREHFRTASQTIASHNASFVKQVREEYQAELKSSAQLREEVKNFMNRASQSVESLELRVDEVASKANALAAEAREELEELNRRRKRDKTSADNELKALKKRLGGVFDNSDAVLRGIEHIYSVLDPVLESELMQCALEKQDAIDRDRISLMGVKDDELTLARSTHTEPQRPRPECRLQSAPGGLKPNKTSKQKPVVRVDNRCVSCSGQAPLVLAAFKMACLHYAPSPIDHRGHVVERHELLERREQLLLTASRSLLRGPGALTEDGGDELGMTGRAGAPSDTSEEKVDAFADYAVVEVQCSGRSKPSRSQDAMRLPNMPQSGPPRTPRIVA
ncbi:unnamed protein product [Durusdinium trenchii]|uniref:Uncharacterized protein n=1 Tax=Durusdinium trenchii TaxID=1381693 RepID=A0ABP0RF03_9DINO